MSVRISVVCGTMENWLSSEAWKCHYLYSLFPFSELLDKIQTELRSNVSASPSSNPIQDLNWSPNTLSRSNSVFMSTVATPHNDIVDTIFQGELVSEVRMMIVGYGLIIMKTYF